MKSKALFAKQTRAHVESLCDLLACLAGVAPEEALMERAAVGTRMLAGTASLMGLGGWEELLGSLHALVDRYHAGGYAWDERLAQVVSEVIEREEALVAACEGDAAVDLAAIATEEDVAALVAEMAALYDDCLQAPPAEAPDAEDAAPAETTETAEPADAVDLYALGAGDAADDGADNVPLAGLVAGLRVSARGLVERFASPQWMERVWDSPEMAEIRTELCRIGYFARAADRIIGRASGGQSRADGSTVAPLRTSLDDFALELTRTAGRQVSVRLEGGETHLDAALLPAVDSVLQHMITDVFDRCESEEIAFTVEASARGGATAWRLSDDGDNFVSDSRLDHEDHLAFYPSLLQVVRTLGRLHSVLWVEPENGHRARFEFTLPVSMDPEPVLVWGEREGAFAVRASQVCDLLPASTSTRSEDAYGDYLEIDRRRVPLLRLDALHPEAPGASDTIAVVGALEKRVAFYVPTDPRVVDAPLVTTATSAWQGPPQASVAVDGGRVPLLEPEGILAGYLDLLGTLGASGSAGAGSENSGGVLENGGVPQSQAASAQAKTSPPDATPPDIEPAGRRSAGEGVDVVVVEQNDTLREAIAGILARDRLSAACVAGVDEALVVIRAREPRVIISEFRMPTMAAKKLVDSLRDEGRTIPVLVTTSQSGKTAELLVEKLGASGYVSKPLHPEELTSRISAYLSQRAAT
jgi:CheY-like chemotaxis protein